MIEIKGNLLSAKEEYIGHGVNCKGKMGKGIAKLVASSHPIVFREYAEYCKKQDIIGTYQVVFSNNKHIINFFTQEAYGNDGVYASLEAIAASIVSFITDHPSIKTIAIPRIGTGLGGLSWEDEVKPLLYIIEQRFDVSFTVYNIS